MIVNIFDKRFIDVYQFDKINDYSGKTELDIAVENIFNNEEVKKNGQKCSPNCSALCTVFLQQTINIPKLLNLENNELGKWMFSKFTESAKKFKLEEKCNINEFYFYRCWGNRLFKNADEGISHRHRLSYFDVPHLVAIYYHYVPEDGANLVFIKDQDEMKITGRHHSTYPEKDKIYFKPKTGMLVIHDPTILHAVTPHTSDIPRTCFIFEPAFKN